MKLYVSPATAENLPRLLVEIGVAGAAVERAVPDADIREADRAVGADRNIAGQVGHDIVDTGIPTQRELRRQVPKPVTTSLMVSNRVVANGVSRGAVVMTASLVVRLRPYVAVSAMA